MQKRAFISNPVRSTNTYTDDELYTLLKPLKAKTLRGVLAFFMEEMEPGKGKGIRDMAQIESVLVRLNMPS